MAIWIGIDEAGYGPNLGPLVIGATVWEATPNLELHDWAARLAAVFRRTGDETTDSDTRLIVDDSKLVYQSGKGLGNLERSVLALSRLCGGKSDDADKLRSWLDATFEEGAAHQTWRNGGPARLPCASPDICSEEILAALASGLKSAGIHVNRVAGKLVYPQEFNRRLEKHDNKAAVLSEATMELVCGLLGAVEGDNVILLCDKHGGRDRYFALLTHFFPDERIEIIREGEEESAYRWRNVRGKFEIRFSAKGERHLPTAAASMTAKYVRELCMAEWNAFWVARIPGLEPTAGYPLDARRFRKAIEEQTMKLGWEETHYWRLK